MLLTRLVICFILYERLEFRYIKRSLISNGYKYQQKRALWKKQNLSYSLLGNVASRDQTSFEAVKITLKEAFKEWEKNSCFRFYDLSPSLSADIKVIFTNDKLNHLVDFNHNNCDRKFRGTAAHAYFRYHKKFPANIHVNNELFWIESKAPKGSISLKTVLLHEIGHVLGLYHSQDINSIMYESVFTNRIKTITKRDKNDLNLIYKTFCKQQENFI